MQPLVQSWFTEQVDVREMHQFLKEKRSTCFRTKFQQVELHFLKAFGRTLVLDGAVQSSDEDEHLFHEALVHPALLSHQDPKRVLILGGGEGATLREVLKHPSIQEAVMVDIDGDFVDFCKERLPDWNRAAFSDPRTKLEYMDGRTYLEKNTDTYDIIITDITDIIMDGPAVKLYTREFYKLCSERLNPGGLIAIQALELSSAVWEQHGTIRRTLAKSFPYVSSYSIYVPSFTSTWGFLLGGLDFDPMQISQEEIGKRIESRGLADKLFAYDENTHSGLFSISKDLRKYLSFEGSILEDNKPLVFLPADTNFRKGVKY